MLVKVYNDIQEMTGIGEEWLLDAKGDVTAVFIDGNLRCQVFAITNGQEKTKIAQFPLVIPPIKAQPVQRSLRSKLVRLYSFNRIV